MPNSILASLAIHAFVVGIFLIATFFVAQKAKESPVIFELVAGEGNFIDQLEAPALGNSTQPIKLEVPVVETIASMPDEPPVTTTVQTQPEEAVVPPPPIEKTKPKAVEKAKAPEKTKAPEKAKPDNSMVNEMKKSQKISYSEYLRKHPTPKQPKKVKTGPPAKLGKAPRVDAQGIAAGVVGGSKNNQVGGAGGKALSREEQDRMSTYISLLIQELKKAHEPPPGVSDRLETRVTFDITASGAILNPRISKSSGDKEFDASVLDAFLRMRSIGPTPNRRSDTWTVTFRMRDME